MTYRCGILKKILSVALALVLLLSYIPTGVRATEEDTVVERISINKNVNFVGMSIWWYDGRVLKGSGTGSGEVARAYQSLIKEQFSFLSTTDYCYSGVSMGSIQENDTYCIMNKSSTWTGQAGDIWTLDTITNDFWRGVPIGTIEDYRNNTGNGTYYGALRLFQDKIVSLSGEEAIVICANALCRYGYDYAASPNSQGHTMQDYETALKEVAQLNSWYFVDQYRNSGVVPGNLSQMTIDGLHLNNAGYEMAVRPWIAQFKALAALETESLGGKTISILGDSISTFAGYLPTEDGTNLAHATFYPNSVITSVEQTWWHQVITSLDAKLGINDSWSGSRVLNTIDGNSGNLGEDAAMASMTRIRNLGSNGMPDVILFFGGTNDIAFGSPLGSFDPASAPVEVDVTATKWSTYADAYVAAIMRMQHLYPKAKIVAIQPAPNKYYYTDETLVAYSEVAKSICAHYGVVYCDLVDGGFTKDLLADVTHPNAEGMTQIAEIVTETLSNHPPVVLESLSLKYDDHYDVTGKTVEIIDAGKPTSYQVGYGVAENAVLDTAVVTLEGNALVATGIGTAKVKIDGVTYEITVDKAKINVVVIMGQSNAGNHFANATSDITCPEGTAYWWGNGKGTAATEPVAYTKPSMGFHTPLLAELYAQSVAAGDPVKNVMIWQEGITSKNGKSITAWASSATDTNGTNATATMIENCLGYYAQHSDKYEVVGKGVYWLQGESDTAMDPEEYTQRFMAMWSKLKTAGMDYLAFFRVRKAVSENDAEHTDLGYTGSLSAQINMINSNPDMFMATTLTENWVGNQDTEHSVDISNYITMMETYGHQESHNDSYGNMATVTDGILTTTMKTLYGSNNKCHYGKFGYGLIAADAARNMYRALRTEEFSIVQADTSGHAEVQTISAPGTICAIDITNMSEDLSFRAACGSAAGTLSIQVMSGETDISKKYGVIVNGGVHYGAVSTTTLKTYPDVRIFVTYTTADGTAGTVTYTVENRNPLPPVTDSTASYTWDFEEDLYARDEKGNVVNSFLSGALYGSYTLKDGVLNSTNAQLQLEKPILLSPWSNWSLEWKYGTLPGGSQGFFLSELANSAIGNKAIWHAASGRVVICDYADKTGYYNYTAEAASIADHDTFRLVNTYNEETGESVISLWKNGEMVVANMQNRGDINNYNYDLDMSGYPLTAEFAFAYLGCRPFLLTDELDYIKVVEGTDHEHAFESSRSFDTEGHWIVCTECAGVSNYEKHTFTSSVTAPTCTEKGYTTHTCACGDSYTDSETDVVEHDYACHVTLPQGTTTGYTTYTCTACSDTYQAAWLDPSAYEGMTLACVGDSITAAVGVTKDETDYVTLLAEQLGMDYIRLGANGTTLCTDGSRTCNIIRLTEGYLKGADVVTIAMGINDFCAAAEGYYELGDIDSTDSSTIYGAVRMWCERIVELRKTDSLGDTQFYFVTPVVTSWNHSVTNQKNWDQSKTNIHGYTLRDLCNAIIEVAALYDVAVIDLNLLSGMYYVDAQDNNTAEFGGDGVHPGAKGHEMMANALAKALLQNQMRDDHEHSYGSWIVTDYSTCQNGIEQRVCSVCTVTQSRPLEPNAEHRYTSAITEPTCTQQGYTTHTCTVCGDSYVDGETVALGHSYNGPTCTICGEKKPDVSEAPENPLATGWPILNTDLTHIICYGQSFSQGADAPGYPDAVVDGVYVYGGITGSTPTSTLKPLQLTSGYQHPIASAVNSFAKLLNEAGIDTDIIAGSYGVGGKTIAQLMSAERQAQIKAEEGYTYDCLSSGRYAVFQSSVAALAEYATNTQQTISCPVIVYLQGETDQNTDGQLGYPNNPQWAAYAAGGDKEKYKEYMSRLKEDMQREVMEAYGQTEKPLFIIYQISGTYVRTQYSTINMAQIEFAQENEDVILVQTPYFTPHYTVSHHLTVNGYRWLGEYIAKYMYTALVERQKPWPMLPGNVSVESDSQIRITVNGVQNGLSIDTWTVENATNGNNLYGFNVYVDGTRVKPQSVAVSGNEILLTMPESAARLLTADSIYVQYAGQSAQGTGNIRDNATAVGYYAYLDDSTDTGTGNNQGVSHSALDENGNSIIGKNYPLYNWLASFSYHLSANGMHVHNYTAKVIPPVCNGRGYTAHFCSCGDAYADSFVDATGVHSYEPVVTEPTCTEDGYTTYICICGQISAVGEHVAALGHAEIIDPAVLPTAEKTGLTQGSHCERCHTVLTAQQTLPATGYTRTLADGAFKVLLIGNTFSEDAANYGQGMTTSQLLDILQAMLGDDVQVVVGLCHASATSMAWHATQAERETVKYNLRVIDSETGKWSTVGAVTSAYALQWADWDAVVLQPFSTEAFTGKANPIHAEQEDEKFYPLEVSTAYMLDHVNKYAPHAEIYSFMHWQRTKTNKLNVSLGSHNNMAAFFPTVMEYRGTNSGARYTDIIPVGTAIQNARTTYLALLSYNTEGGMNLTDDPQFGLQRDENHLSLNVGRYIAGLTFAETILPGELRVEGYELPEIRITESIGKLPTEYTEIAQKSVFAAMESWKQGNMEVTTIVGYETDPAVTAAEKLEDTVLEIPFAMNSKALEIAIMEQAKTILGEDFAVDKVSFPEEFAHIGKAQSIEVTATVRFGYTSVDALVRVSVGDCLPGDINGDGEVNNKDATRLFQHMTGWNVEVVEAALDVNGDGKVNNKDATRLFQYLSGWDVEIYL